MGLPTGNEGRRRPVIRMGGPDNEAEELDAGRSASPVAAPTRQRQGPPSRPRIGTRQEDRREPMIQVIVQLVDARLPDGDPQKIKVIASADIVNDGTLSDGSGNSAFGKYQGLFRYHVAARPQLGDHRFSGFRHHRPDGIWRLIRGCLNEVFAPAGPSGRRNRR